ncbi:MAG: ABC transporter permease [Desulforudis sp.]|jgi:simple sugar transport system permease protein|nr:MAG: ABC transporter permease [Desulforudis sp.]
MKFGGGLITLEKRAAPSPVMAVLVPVISVVLALLVGAVFLKLTGQGPFPIYMEMFSRAFGTRYGLSETIVKSIPLMLAGLGVAVAFRMQLWNIGGEGQLFMGAFAATWVALNFPDQPAWFLLPLMFFAGCVGGGVWGLIPALPRAYMGVNEIITTLMLNYVAILWVEYLVYGPWKDPQGYNFPLTAKFSAGAILPTLGDSRIHAGLLFGLTIAVVLWVVFNRTRWGYEIRVIGDSPGAARFAGMNIPRNILVVMAVSGAVCGLAGMAEVSGLMHRLQPGFSPGYGYTAIIIAWLAKLNPLAIVLVAFLFGGLQVGGYIVQTSGVPATMVAMLQGSVLFFILGGDILLRYRLRWRRPPDTTVKGKEVGT